MVKKVGTVSAKLCTFQCICCVQDTRYKQKSEVQELPARGRKVLQSLEKQTTPRGPKQDPPGRLSRVFRVHKFEKIVAGGEGKKKYPARPCQVCAAHTK